MNKRHLTQITLLNTYSHRIYPPSKFIESSKTGHDRSPTKILSLVSSLTKEKKRKKKQENITQFDHLFHADPRREEARVIR